MTPDGPDDAALTFNQHVIERFRAGAELEGMHRERLLLLTTTGRRSGESRTAPMMFHVDGEAQDGRPRRVVIASGNGAPSDPAWVANLVAEPHVHVEVDGDEYDADARVAQDAEHDRLWADITAAYPFFLEHAERAGRVIPLVTLEPADA